MRLALFQPDIPQNTGAMLRLGACLGVPVDIIEPCGFPFGDKGLRRAGLDYLDQVDLTRHISWAAFGSARGALRRGRLLLMTTTGDCCYTDFGFAAGDTIMMGRESAGVPEDVHAQADARLIIPMADGARSLNVALAAALALGEALRQTGEYPSTHQARVQRASG